MFQKTLKGWKDLVDRPDAIVSLTDQENNNNLSQMRYGIGFTDLGAITMGKMKVRPIAIDGVEATAENVQSGKYAFVKELGFCFKGAPQGRLKEFVDFVFSPEGARILVENGFVPLK